MSRTTTAAALATLLAIACAHESPPAEAPSTPTITRCRPRLGATRIVDHADVDRVWPAGISPTGPLATVTKAHRVVTTYGNTGRVYRANGKDIDHVESSWELLDAIDGPAGTSRLLFTDVQASRLFVIPLDAHGALLVAERKDLIGRAPVRSAKLVAREDGTFGLAWIETGERYVIHLSYATFDERGAPRGETVMLDERVMSVRSAEIAASAIGGRLFVALSTLDDFGAESKHRSSTLRVFEVEGRDKKLAFQVTVENGINDGTSVLVAPTAVQLAALFGHPVVSWNERRPLDDIAARFRMISFDDHSQTDVGLHRGAAAQVVASTGGGLDVLIADDGASDGASATNVTATPLTCDDAPPPG